MQPSSFAEGFLHGDQLRRQVAAPPVCVTLSLLALVLAAPLAAQIAPRVTVAHLEQWSFEDKARCAMTCFAAVYAQGTVPYYSLGTARNVTLVYHGDRLRSRPFVHVDVKHPSGTLPQAFWLEAKVSGALVTFVNGETRLRFQATTDSVRLAGQFDASGHNLGVQPLEIIVTSDFGGAGIRQTSVQSSVMIMDERFSTVAKGWSLGGVQRVWPIQYDGSLLLTDGFGSAMFFQATCVANCGGGDDFAEPTDPPVYVFTSPLGDFTQLVPGRLSSATGYSRLYPDGTRVEFQENGFITEIRDAFNNVTQFEYDANMVLLRIRDPMNKVITLGYSNQKLATIQDPGGRTTTLTVQANGTLTRIQDPDGVGTDFGYDANFRLQTITNRRGHTTTLAYSSAWKLASTIGPQEYFWIGGVLGPNNSTSSQVAWQEAGVPFSSTGTPVPAVRADTVRGRVMAADGSLTRFTVDRWGQPRTSLDPLAGTTTVAYTFDGLAARIALPTYGAAEFDSLAYDSQGLPLYVKPAGQAAVRMRYAGFAQADSIWGDGRPTVRRFIGANGRLDSTRIAGVFAGRTKVDSRGRADSTWDGKRNVVRRYTYDATSGNLYQELLPGARSVTYTYDSHGRGTTRAQTGYATSTTYYDLLNRPDSVRDGVNSVATRYGYDGLFLTSLTDPKGQVYGMLYDKMGWVTRRTDPVGRYDTYAYDVSGRLREWGNRRGQSVRYDYDAFGRLTTKFGPNADSVSWTYAHTSARTVAGTSPVATETQYLNAQGQPDSVRTQIAGQTFWVRSRYTTTGQLDSVVPTGASISFLARKYLYNAQRGTLDSIRLGGVTTGLGYDANFQRDLMTRPSGEQVSYANGMLHTMTSATTSASYAPEVEVWPGYDIGGRIAQQLDNDAGSGRFYEYDGLGRLTWSRDKYLNNTVPPGCPDPENPMSVICWTPGDWVTTAQRNYSYDAAGNRTDLSASYTTGNRITNFNSCTYATDYDGNVTNRTCAGDTVSFVWTADNLLRSAMVNGSTNTYHYDAGGRLARKDAGATPSRHFVWDGASLLAELNGTATAKVGEYSWYPGLDVPHAVITGTTPHYAHQDALGNVLALTAGVSSLSRNYAYDDWGTLTQGTDYAGLSGADRSRWKGALWAGPEADLYYMRNRWYEPRSGRFLSEDPIGLAGGINVYAYAMDDPINRRDPMGLCDNVVAIIERRFSDGSIEVEYKYDCSSSGPSAGPSGYGDWYGGWGGPLAPFSPNAGAGGGGNGGAGGGGRADDDASDWKFCAANVALAGLVVASDLATFTGAGAALKLGAVALGRSGLARVYATNAINRVFVGSEIATANAYGSAATRVGLATAGGSVTSSVELNTYSSSLGSQVSWKDFIPGWASARAISSARAACQQ